MRANLGNGQRTVWAVGGVTDVDDVLVGQLVDDRARDGQPADAIVSVPADFGYELGLASVVSPLRLRGLAGMLARIKAAIARAG